MNTPADGEITTSRAGRAEPEQLLEAARRVFLDRGYARATLEAVAEEAGFSKGVVYSQFGSKGDLFMALLDRRIEERASQNEEIAAGLVSADGVRELVRDALREEAANSGWVRLLVEFRALASHDPAGRAARSSGRRTRPRYGKRT